MCAATGSALKPLLGEINSRGAGVKIALLDASRRNPFERRFRSFSAGLAPVIAPSGSLVMYSAALSSVVTDNGGDRSLFVGELLKEIGAPGLTAEEMLNRTRVNVTRASRSEQVPWISSSLAEDFAFVPGAKAVAAPPPPEPVAPPSQPATDTPAPAPPPAPPVEAVKPPPPATEPAKQALAEPSKPAAPSPPPATESKPPETALADDPTIKRTDAQARRQSQRRRSAVSPRPGLCLKGRLSVGLEGFRRHHPAQPARRRGLQQPLLGAHRDRRSAEGADATATRRCGCDRTSSTRWIAAACSI